MAGFLYYLAGKGTDIEAAELHKLGLGYAFDEERCAARGVRCGPEGSGEGIVVANPQSVPEHLIRFEPTRQTWRKVPKTDAYVGIYTDENRPGPEDVQRTRILSGHLVMA